MKDVKMRFDRILLFCVAFQEAHVNQCYKHFYYFVTELNLVERKELEPLVSQLLQVAPICLCTTPWWHNADHLSRKVNCIFHTS